MAETNRITTPVFRLCYSKIADPEIKESDGKQYWSCTAVFPKGTDLSALKAAAKHVVANSSLRDKKGIRSPFCDGNVKADEWGEVFRDATYIRFSTNRPPKTADKNRQPIPAAEFYSGCYARALVHPYAYDNVSQGVLFTLDAIQFMKDGDELGGLTEKAAMDAFAEAPIPPEFAGDDDVFDGGDTKAADTEPDIF